ncbi:hypothetical protein KC573_00355 [candidate division WWE3 bacterium]|uniref:Uncharacterized protein n=1 Tax=candidate division WWE3 bacterium TaxID=2053526 RepID=A0A955RWP4_UNCKA|nr:hypothetical protein [candidate division WWE3 bacterium]
MNEKSNNKQQLVARCPQCGEEMIFEVSDNTSSPVKIYDAGHEDDAYITKTEQQKNIELVEAGKNMQPNKVR